MNLGEAAAIFRNIDLSERTVSEKRLAIKTVLAMDTHNGIIKQEFINALDWLMCHPTAYDVDKVVRKLEEMKENAVQKIALNSQGCDIDGEIENEKKHFDNLIELVKAGEANE